MDVSVEAKGKASSVTLDGLLDEARSRLHRAAPDEIDREREAGALVVDVRTSEQRRRDGDLPGALVIDLTVLEWRLAPSSDHRELNLSESQRVILVCSEGYSSSLAAARLQELGLVNATDLVGGFLAWRAWKNGVASVDRRPPAIRPGEVPT